MNLELELKRLGVVTMGTLLFVIGVSFFIVPADLIPGGLTGIAAITQYGVSALGLQLNLGLFVIIYNIPIMLLAIKGISKTFVYYTLYSVILQGILFAVIGEVDQLFADDVLAASVLGGILIGLGAAIALKAGSSLGGLDIVSQYLSLKFQMSIGYIGIFINAFILGFSLLLYTPELAFYTLLSFVVTNLLIDRLHTAYKRVRLDILTVHGENVKAALMENVVRGITIQDAKGAYTGEHRTILWMVTQTHEVYDIKKIVLDIDPKAFITMTPIRHLNGEFNRVIIK